jgi:hypothetical protein
MALILARSPYHISRGVFDSGAQLTVDIGTIDNAGVFTSLKTPPYSLSFRNETHLDIAPFVRDFLIDNEVLVVKTTLSGTENDIAISDVVTEYIATDGYAYYEDGSNKDFTDLLKDTTAYYAGSNNVVYRNRSEPIRIPLLNPDVADANNATGTTIIFYKDDIELDYESIDFGYYDNASTHTLQTSKRVHYPQEDGIESFEERVTEDSGIYESDCNNEFDVAYTENTPNRVVITPKGDTSKAYELTIIPVRECNYTPNRIIFLNKFGVEEEFWFFKKSVDNMTTSRESFRANTLPNYLNDDLSKHSYASYNVNGKKTMNMNTGFIPESFKENIRQLMLSEKVWIQLDGNKLPITIKNSDMVLKKSINEKLINYEIEIEFAYDIINTIG